MALGIGTRLMAEEEGYYRLTGLNLDYTSTDDEPWYRLQSSEAQALPILRC